MAKARLISVFDLSDAQADYILELQLRRLTRFSRIELETERDELQRQIEELEAILADEKLLHRTVSTELADVAKAHGTPRRTVLLESAGTPGLGRPRRSRSPTTPAGCCSRRPGCSPAPRPPTRCRARAAAPSTTPSSGPCAPPREASSRWSPRAAGWCGCRRSSCRPCHRSVARRACRGGAPLAVYVDLPAGEEPLTIVPLDADGPGPRAGHRAGRRQAGHHRLPRPTATGRPSALRDGDTRGRRRGAARRRRGPRLRHERRPAAALPRRRGAAAGALGRWDGRASGSRPVRR